MTHPHPKSTILYLLREMKSKDSWCGETHLQKSVFLLEEGFGVDLEFEFVMYKHGPFSFDLRDALGGMEATLVIDVQSTPPYGSQLSVSSSGDRLIEHFASMYPKESSSIRHIAEHFSNRRVKDLERISTALFVNQEQGEVDLDQRILRFCELKPHISGEEAELGFRNLDDILRTASQRLDFHTMSS